MRRMISIKKEFKEEFKLATVVFNKGGYKVCPEGPIHVVVYKKIYGKPPSGWHIHHIDCNKLNNTPDNLIALPKEVHVFIHKEIKRTKRIITRSEFQFYIDQFNESMKLLKELNQQIKALEFKRASIFKRYDMKAPKL